MTGKTIKRPNILIENMRLRLMSVFFSRGVKSSFSICFLPETTLTFILDHLDAGTGKDFPKTSFRRRERSFTEKGSVMGPNPGFGLGVFVVLWVDSGKNCMSLEGVLTKHPPQHGQQEKDKEKNRPGKNKKDGLGIRPHFPDVPCKRHIPPCPSPRNCSYLL
jgi:hypothetical protein